MDNWGKGGTVSSKLVYKFSLIPIKIAIRLFPCNLPKDLKSLEKENLQEDFERKKNKEGKISIPDMKPCYSVIVTSPVGY